MSTIYIDFINISNDAIDIFKRHFCCDYHRDLRNEITVLEIFIMLLGTYSIFYQISSFSLQAFKDFTTHHFFEDLGYAR